MTRTILLTGAGLAALLMAAPAAAQTGGADDSVVSEIVVTAQKRSEDLQDVPVSIQAIGGGAAPSTRVFGRSCQNCHSQIHGSNHPAGARFQR